MVRALQYTVVLGVTTNIPYLLDILQHPLFVEGKISTRFLEEQFPEWQPIPDTSSSTWLALAAFEALKGESRRATASVDGASDSMPDPWATLGGWRNVESVEPVSVRPLSEAGGMLKGIDTEVEGDEDRV
jgi:acetyl/propionyl-CoA carboxylase alpha subunit